MSNAPKRMTGMSNLRRYTSSSVTAIAVAAMLQMPAHQAHAELLDQLKSAVGAGQSGQSGQSGGGLLGGAGIPSVDHASPTNVAGVLQYCIQNKYVSGGGASSVKESLMSKLTGSGKSTNDSAYTEGSNGLLQTGNSQNYSLGGGGIKAQLTQKVCDLVLQHAKSLL
jgi:hypothetical protein